MQYFITENQEEKKTQKYFEQTKVLNLGEKYEL